MPLACSQENHKLRDQNDDLNGQILSLSLYEAKNLFATQTTAQSLAAEIDTASRDEVTWPFALALAFGAWPSSESCPTPTCQNVEPQAAGAGKAGPGLDPESPYLQLPCVTGQSCGGS